jgi:hypothetical protein
MRATGRDAGGDAGVARPRVPSFGARAPDRPWRGAFTAGLKKTNARRRRRHRHRVQAASRRAGPRIGGGRSKGKADEDGDVE